jgi:sugar lactone lactonase YvrE
MMSIELFSTMASITSHLTQQKIFEMYVANGVALSPDNNVQYDCAMNLKFT